MVDEQAFENIGEQAVDEDGFPDLNEAPEFESTVEQETQAKVDANHLNGIADTISKRIHDVTPLASLIPIGFILLDIDPALGSGPLATALQDIISIVIYFLLAISLL